MLMSRCCVNIAVRSTMHALRVLSTSAGSEPDDQICIYWANTSEGWQHPICCWSEIFFLRWFYFLLLPNVNVRINWRWALQGIFISVKWSLFPSHPPSPICSLFPFFFSSGGRACRVGQNILYSINTKLVKCVEFVAYQILNAILYYFFRPSNAHFICSTKLISFFICMKIEFISFI